MNMDQEQYAESTAAHSDRTYHFIFVRKHKKAQQQQQQQQQQ